MKRLYIVFALILLITTLMPVSSSGVSNKETTYEAQVANIMSTYRADPEKAKQALAQLETELLGEPRCVTECPDGESTRGTSPSNYSLLVYSFKRGGSRVHYLQWVLESNRSEWFYGPLDAVSLEWDTAYASYYSANGDDEISTVQGRSTGIVLFNIEDDKLDNGVTTHGTVQVSPKAAGTMVYGSKFTHTYTDFVFAGSVTYSYAPSSEIALDGGFSLGLTYTMGYTISVGTTTNQWQLWADNAVTLPDYS